MGGRTGRAASLSTPHTPSSSLPLVEHFLVNRSLWSFALFQILEKLYTQLPMFAAPPMCSESWSRGDKDWVVLCTTAGCCCCCYRRRAVTPPPPPTLKYFLRTLQIFLVSCTTLPKFQACVPHTAVVMRVNDTGAAMKLCAVWPCCLLLRSEGRGER